jgi:plastocyanin
MSPQPRSRSTVRGLLAALGALAISVPGLACGDDDDGGSASSGAATEAASTTSTNEAAAGAGGVAAFDFGFDPNTTTISAGDSLTWENTGETTHNVKGKGFFSDGMEPGDTFEHKFADAGVYDYLCTLHPDSMTGTVVVE